MLFLPRQGWGDTKRPFLAQAWKLRAGTARFSLNHLMIEFRRGVSRLSVGGFLARPHLKRYVGDPGSPVSLSILSWPMALRRKVCSHLLWDGGGGRPAGPPMVSSHFPPGRKSLVLTAVRVRRKTPWGKLQVRRALVCNRWGPGNLAAQEFRRWVWGVQESRGPSWHWLLSPF